MTRCSGCQTPKQASAMHGYTLTDNLPDLIKIFLKEGLQNASLV
jgi:hypothetical protein